MAVYVGSDISLPLIPWDKDNPAFYVAPAGESDAAVRTKLNERNVYYAGSHEGCGCGFQYGEYPEFEDDKKALKRASLDNLAEYLERALAGGAQIRIFACWEGEQGLAAEHQRDLTPSALRSDAFFFHQRELSIVRADDRATCETPA